jgi:hypothetical protein
MEMGRPLLARSCRRSPLPLKTDPSSWAAGLAPAVLFVMKLTEAFARPPPLTLRRVA